jgi:hypothetical protein
MMSGGEGEWGGQKVLSKPSADSFAVSRRQKDLILILLCSYLLAINNEK